MSNKSDYMGSKWEVEQGINMGPANALSMKDAINTNNDNWEITLLKGQDQDFHIHALNTTLTEKITQSSVSNPIVL